MGTPVNIIVGSHVWAEDPEAAWIDGEVIEIKGRDATIVATNGKTIVADISSIYPKDTEAPPAGVDDMTKLAYLHEPGVLCNLASRFALNEIYTYTGNILIAVNPFRRLPHLYDIHMMEQYKGAAFGELSPHLFAVADTCYRAMINEHGSQSILVSGESGAGKTETTKMLMRYLAFMGGRSNTEGRTVEQQVLESNPVLEAFGNAKTVKNNNSSRFGKFVEIQFDKHGKISGAAVRTYLLERSRVCQVSDPERNYHIFYMLCAAPPEVPPMITRKIFSQVFSFINVQLFNSLLLRRECCSFSNGEYVKAGLQEIEQWCIKATDQFVGSSWDELQHIRQAVGFLVLHQKPQKSLDEITNELCPMLSIPQIYRIGTMFWDDKYGTHGLSPEVIGKMRALMAEDSISMPNNSFLLDVDSGIPFSMEDMSRSFLNISLPDVDPPPLLRQRSDFHFLLQQTD